MVEERERPIVNLKTSMGRYYVLAVLIIIIYIFFFASKWIFFNLTFVEHSTLGEEMIVKENVTANVCALNYSENQDLIEAEIEVTNEGSELKNDFDFYAMGKNKFGFKTYALDTKVVLDTNNLRVVDIENVNKKFVQISLVIVPKGTDISSVGNSEGQNYIFYIDHTNITKATNIKDIGYNGYLGNKLKRDIKGKEAEVKKLNRDIEALEKENAELLQRNNELRSQEMYLTGEEREKLTTEENNNTSHISQNESLINNYNVSIAELNNQISALKNNLKQLTK